MLGFSQDESQEATILKKRLGECNQQLAQSQQSELKAKNELEQLRSKTKTLETTRDNAEVKCDRAERRVAELEAECRAKTVANQIAEQALTKSRDQLQERNKNRRLDEQTRDDAVGAREKELIKERDELEQKYSKLEARLREAQADANHRPHAGPSHGGTNGSRLEAEIMTLKAEVEHLRRSASTSGLAAHNSPGGQSTRSLKSRRSSGINVTGSEEQQLREINSELSKKIEKAEDRAARAERDALKVSNERLASERRNQGTIEALKTQRDDLKDEIKLRDHHVNTLERQWNAVVSLLGGHDGHLDNAEGMVRDLVAKSRDADAVSQTLSNALTSASGTSIGSNQTRASLADMAATVAKSLADVQGRWKKDARTMQELQRESGEMRGQLAVLEQTTETLRRREKELAGAKRTLKKLSSSLRKALPTAAGLSMADVSMTIGGVGEETTMGDTTMALRGFEADVMDEVEQLLTFVEDLDGKLEFQRIEHEIRETNALTQCTELKEALAALQERHAEAGRIHALDEQARKLDLERAQGELAQRIVDHEAQLAKAVSDHQHAEAALVKQSAAYEEEKERFAEETKRALFEAEQREHAQADIASQTAAHLLGLLSRCQEASLQDAKRWQALAEDNAEEVWSAVRNQSDRLKTAAEDLDAQAAELERLHGDVQTLEKKISDVRQTLTKTEEELTARSEELQIVEDSDQQKAEDIERLHKKLELHAELETAFRQKRAQVKDLEARLDRFTGLEDELVANGARITELEKTLKDAEADRSAKQDNIARLQIEIVELRATEQALEDERQTNQALRLRLDELPVEQEAARLAEAELEDVRRKLTVLQTLHDQTVKEQQADREHLNGVLQQLASAQNARGSLTEELTQLRTKVSALQQVSSSKTDEAAKIEEEIAAVRETNRELLVAMDGSIERARKEARFELDSVQADLTATRKEIGGLQERVQRRDEQIALLQGEVQQEQMNRKLAEDALKPFVATRETDVTVMDESMDRSKMSASLASTSTTDLERFQLSVSELGMQSSSARSQISSLEEQQAKSIAELQVKSAAHDAAVERASALEKELEQVNEHYNGAKQELTDLQAQQEETQARFAALQEQHTALEAEKADLIEQLNELEQYIEELGEKEQIVSQQYTASLTELHDSQSERLQGLEAEVQDKRRALVEAEEKMQDAQSKIAAVRESEAKVQQQADAVRAQLEKEQQRQTAGTEELAEQLAVLEAEKAYALRSAEEQSAALEQARAENVAIARRMAAAENQLNDSQDALDQAQEEARIEIASAQDTITQLQQQLENQAEAVATAANERIAGRDILQEAQKSAKAAQEEATALREQLESLQRGQVSQTAVPSDTTDRLAALEEDLAMANAAVAQLEEELTIKAQECEDADDKELMLRKDNKRLTARIATMQARLDKYQAGRAGQSPKANAEARQVKDASASPEASKQLPITSHASSSDVVKLRKRLSSAREEEENDGQTRAIAPSASRSSSSPNVIRAFVYAPGPTSLITVGSATTKGDSADVRDRPPVEKPVTMASGPVVRPAGRTSRDNTTPHLARTAERSVGRRETYGVQAGRDPATSAAEAKSLHNSLNRSAGASNPSQSVALRLQQQLAAHENKPLQQGTATANSTSRLKDRTNKPRDGNSSSSGGGGHDAVAIKLAPAPSATVDNHFMTKLNRFKPTATAQRTVPK